MTTASTSTRYRRSATRTTGEGHVGPRSKLINGKRIEFIKSSVRTVDTERRVVETTEGEMTYDILVIALGSHVAYFGIEGLEENSVTLSSFEVVKEIRSRIE